MKKESLSVGNKVYQEVEKDIAAKIEQAKNNNNDKLLKKLASKILQKIQFRHKHLLIKNVIYGIVDDRDEFTINPEKKTEGGITISLRDNKSHIYTIITIDYDNKKTTKTERIVTFNNDNKK